MNNKTNSKNKLALKLGVIALIAVLALSTIFVAFINSTTINAQASMSARATFVDIRTGTLGNPSTSLFRSTNFQANTANFTYRFHGHSELSGISLANLVYKNFIKL